MQRRDSIFRMLAGLSSTALAVTRGAPPAFAATETRFHLSRKGSGRASAYSEAVKTITVGDRTHVTWLDSLPVGFRVQIRTLDHATGTWSPVYSLGPAHDNHGGPALTVDHQGFLHVIYYPHHHPFHYRRSTRPNDASQWNNPLTFGERLTYPTLLCNAQDTLYLTGRRSYASQPWTIQQWTKPRHSDWQAGPELLRAQSPGYSHFQAAMAWSPDSHRLHLSCRIHENGGQRETVGYLYKDLAATTWKRLDGTPVVTPATSDTVDPVAVGGRAEGQLSHKCGSIAVHPDGTPYILFSATSADSSEMYIASPDRQGGWSRRGLASTVERIWPGFHIAPAAQMTFNLRGELFVTACIRNGTREDVVRLHSPDMGQTFTGQVLSSGLNREHHWFANLERSTGANIVRGIPGVLFTAGVKGSGNTDLLSNDVYWCGTP